MIGKKEKDWFKIKRYPHIGLPLNPNDRFKWIEKYVTDPNTVAKHSFLPFIHKTSRVKKFRKEYSSETGEINAATLKGKKILRKPSEKKRELFYASHLDSLIFSYYAKLLSDAYETKLKSKEYNLNEVVNAYRSVPIHPEKESSSNKCNIDFANDIFKYILDYPETEFAVIAFDISSFFDNLDHKLLRDIWTEILEKDKLPADHFNVYKNITRFSHIDIVDIFEEFKDKIYTRKTDKLGKPLLIKQKPIEKVKFLRNQDAIAFCTKEEFLKVKGKLLQPSKTKKMEDNSIVYRNFGIPQGSPISSVLANIYLLHFDKTISDFLKSNGGIYRRYSDDMVVVCPMSIKFELAKLVHKEIDKYKLKIQQSKTQIFHFKRETSKLVCGQEYDGIINWNKNFMYLGFEFDGQHVLLKSASLSGYYRKMKRFIHRAKRFSKYKNINNSGEIFKQRIFKKFSYKGAKRTRKYLWNEKENKFEKSESYNWGNFLSYTKKAAKFMVNNKINQQTKRHWNILNKLIK
ncbi:reverse transcriptase domain-containing protein [Bacteroidales bacterium]|nr:reverse transcriptase domain-containing protein [Bacteroidales bacterium]